MLTLLPAKPSLLLLKLTGRLSNEVVLQLAALMEQNLKAAKPVKKRRPRADACAHCSAPLAVKLPMQYVCMGRGCRPARILADHKLFCKAAKLHLSMPCYCQGVTQHLKLEAWFVRPCWKHLG